MTAIPAPVVRRSWSEIFEVFELAAFQHLSTSSLLGAACVRFALRRRRRADMLTCFMLRQALRRRVLVPNGVWLARRRMVRRSAPAWLFRIRLGGWIPGTQ